MKFGLFIALNALVLIRPEELFPEIAGLRLYLIVICVCTLQSLPELMALLSWESLRVRPVTVCVLLYFSSTIVSLCVLGRVEEALLDFGPEFAKIILYYLLLITIVDSGERFRRFIAVLVALIVLLTAIAIAQLHGFASFPNIDPVMQREFDIVTGEEYFIPRLVSSGIFSDPNDLCLILGFGMLSCLYLMTTGDAPLAQRLGYLAPIPLFVYATLETHSRGGVLGVLAGVGGYMYARYGGPKALPLAAGGAFGSLALIGGRQGSMAGGGTAHDRLMFWADGLTNLFNQPLYIPTGLGLEWFTRETGFVAHNSFVQAYVEQGLFGGGTFLGAFVLGAWMTDRLGRGIPAPAWALKARPFVFAILCGYGMGCYSLTRNTVLPTYLIFGIASVLLEPSAPYLPEKFRVDRRWFGRSILMSIVGLVFIKYATQIMGMAGV